MTIDERLEFIATLQQSHDDQIGKMVEQGSRNTVAIAALTGRMDTLAQSMSNLTQVVNILSNRTIQAMDAIGRLANIAAGHDERIEKLENGYPG